jgi:hypothetical protein
LSERPFAIAASDFIEHGTITVASAANDPLAIAAPTSAGLYATSASASSALRSRPSSWWTLSSPAEVATRWISRPARRSRSRRRTA